MRRKRWKLLPVLGLLVTMAMSAVTTNAETSHGNSDWSVVFSKDKKMVSNFKTSDINDAIYGIQPGDNVIITLALKNENDEATDWYMTNEVLYSLEDRSANAGTSGGVYTYKLTYTGPDGEVTSLYDSDTVGGEDANGSKAGEGLRQATNALSDYFFLDTLKKGQSGKVTLEVALDGDTQGNDYQNTLADLQMNFAVELNPNVVREREETENRTNEVTNPDRRVSAQGTSIVRTGDESNLTPFIMASSISGVLFLALSMYGFIGKKEEKKEGQ